MDVFTKALADRAALLAAKQGNKPIAPDPIEVHVTVLYATNELSVTFSRYPGESTIALVKSAGFKWDGSRWHAEDTQKRREFCVKELNAKDLDPLELAPPALDIPVAEEEPEPVELTKFDIYKQQINELLDHLKIDSADLQLLAIDYLHKATFSVN